MTDKRLGQLKIMVGHLQRTLEMDVVDMRIVEKLLSDALDLALNLHEPPDPYADPKLRPGLDVTNYDAEPAAPRIAPHPPQGVPDV